MRGNIGRQIPSVLRSMAGIEAIESNLEDPGQIDFTKPV